MTITWNKVTWYSKLLAVIIFAFAIWLGFYFKSEFKKVEEIKPVLQMTTTDTSDWKTYKNEKYGFEFKYLAYYGLTTRADEFSILDNRDGIERPAGFEARIIKAPSDWSAHRHDSAYINTLFEHPSLSIEGFPITDDREYGHDTINFNVPRGSWYRIIEHNDFLYLFSSNYSMDFLQNFKFTK